MIRFLQKDSRFVKGVFVVIIAVACITMVVTLVPGIFQDDASSADTYAVIGHGGVLGRFMPAQDEISNTDVQQLAQRMLQRQQLPDMLLPYMMQRVGQGLVQQHIELLEAKQLGLNVTDEDIRRFLHSGQWGMMLFPGGKYIGDAQYAEFISEQFGLSRDKFENEVKKEILENRLRSLITGSVTVSDSEVRASYLQQATKIKFDYAVLSSDDLRKTINPTDTELQAFFKQNASRYATAIPEARKIQYIAFTDSNLPQGAPQVSDAEIQQYYQAHQKDYQIDDQVKVRHILIKVDGNDPKADAAAKAKAQGILDQLHHGGDFAKLAKENSDDPGSKEQGGELGWIKHGVTVPEFDQASFSLQPGQTSGLVKSKFGYHIIQTEEKQTAHTRPLDEVKPEIQALLTRQKEGQQEQAFAQQLAAEAQKTGLAATAAAHHLEVVTTDFLSQASVVPGLPDGSKLLSDAFAAKKGAAPQSSSTGGGYAVYQVTDIQPAHAPTFDAYKSHLVEDFRDQQLPQLLAKKTAELADRAHAENDLAKVAKEVGATIKTSDLVGRDAQVPEIGALATAAPQLFDLNPGQISSAISTGHSGVVAKIVDKQQPTSDEAAKNFDSTREALLDQRREEMFSVFVSNLEQTYQKQGRIRTNRKAQQGPGGMNLPG
ncbi:peptidyl-prolyl cis-trans isomerase D [Silvibacterium bohemicum]|uniref:Periplasmic chaperone PpiD n=1 Tax=Silvibacterium bohemicum TaxID=1577686 RepID=A0A841JSL8_9BACT|nr:peptidyl-prolyl cis-trans isomerase [Silvibacterium bohemicum]MBB6143507.1 peptidyl-prolyl cis-trans isomerase D [Silvibacterium bohemicum]